MQAPFTPTIALTVGAADSSGGSGVHADVSTLTAYGHHATAAIAAVHVQSTTGVHAVHRLPSDIVLSQVVAVLSDMRVKTVKVGAVYDADTMKGLEEFARAGLLRRLVLDPTMWVGSGERGCPPTEELVKATRSLVSRAWLVTPSRSEAAAILDADAPADTLFRLRQQAADLVRMGARAAVITGHVEGSERVDVFADSTGPFALRHRNVTTKNGHGAGSTFSAAAAGALGNDESLYDAVVSAQDFTRRALSVSAYWGIGRGQGPVNHLPAYRDHVPLDNDEPLRSLH